MRRKIYSQASMNEATFDVVCIIKTVVYYNNLNVHNVYYIIVLGYNKEKSPPIRNGLAGLD